jgi:hypothetical protein
MALAVAPDEQMKAAVEAVPDAVLAQRKADLRSLLEQVEVQVTEGDDQWVPPGRTPARPIVLRVVAGQNQTPMGGVPVRLTTAGLGSTELGRFLTGAGGIARCALTGPLPEDATEGNLLAELAVRQLAPDADLSGLPIPSVRIRYALRSRSNTMIAVHVVPYGANHAAAQVMSALPEALKAEGFRLVDAQQVAMHVRAKEPGVQQTAEQSIDIDALRDRAGCFVLAIVGEMRGRTGEPVSTDTGKLHMAHCDYSLALIDAGLPEGARTVLSVEGSGRGASLNGQADASLRAQSDAAAAATDAVVSALRSRFGLTASRP